MELKIERKRGGGAERKRRGGGERKREGVKWW